MSNTISPNMNLVIPSVGSESGPTYAFDINSSLTLIDQHDHSAGSGVPITPNGLNINADLAFGSNNATNVRTVRFTAQSAALAGVADLGCIYEAGVDLYYNDGSGNQIRLTQGGSIVGTAGSITGLPSGTASATFAAATFVWQRATSTSATMDFGSAILRNNVANSKGLTLSPPSAMAADYTLTLPTIPPAQYFMSIDTSGNLAGYVPISAGITGSNIASATITGSNVAALTLTGANIANGTLTQVKMGSVGQQTSASCGAFTSNSLTYTPVTNLSVTITSTGRPVMLMVQADTAATIAGNPASAGGISTVAAVEIDFAIFRGIQIVSSAAYIIPGASTFISVPPSMSFLDTPGAGTNTYTVQVKVGLSGTATISNCVLVAYEL